MKFSIIVPVFNRPDEIDELLNSLTRQTYSDFEVVIVEDGSTHPSELVCKKYKDQLDLKYFLKENSGPGLSRNYGVERASGEYVIILDSDVVLPHGYLCYLADELEVNPIDAFGGPDRAHPSFSDDDRTPDKPEESSRPCVKASRGFPNEWHAKAFPSARAKARGLPSA